MLVTIYVSKQLIIVHNKIQKKKTTRSSSAVESQATSSSDYVHHPDRNDHRTALYCYIIVKNDWENAIKRCTIARHEALTWII